MRRGRNEAGLLVRNVVANYLGTALTVAVTLVSLPYVIRGLGAEQYGLWVLTLSVLSYVGLFNFGVGSGVVRFVAAAVGRNDPDELAAVCATGLVSAAGIGGVLTLGLTTVAVLMLPHLGVAPRLLVTARLVLLINATTLLCGSALGIFGDMLLGLERFDLKNGVNVAAKLLEAAAMVGAVVAGGGVVAVALVALGMSVLVHATRYVILTRGLQLTIDPKRFDRKLLGSITTFSGCLLIWRLGVQLIWFTDSVVISTVISVSAVGVYAVAAKFPDLLRLLVGQAQTVFFPHFSRLFGTDNSDGHGVAFVGTAACLGITAPLAAGLVVFARPLIELWVGPGFSSGVRAAQLLTISFVLSLVPSVINSGLHASGRVGIPALLAVAEGLLNLGLSVAFAHRWGLTGVALGTAVAGVAVGGFVGVPYACRCLRIPIGAFLRRVVLPPLLPLPAMLLILPVRAVVYPTTWLALAAEFAFTLVLYYGVLWLTIPAGLRGMARRFALTGIQQLRGMIAGRLASYGEVGT